VQNCTETTSTTNGKKIEYSTREFQRMLLPDTLNHDANAKMEERSRGLHHINTYVLHDQISAGFANAAQYAELPKPSEPNAVVRCKKVLRHLRSATRAASAARRCRPTARIWRSNPARRWSATAKAFRQRLTPAC
jgi:hypothetical protein